MPARGPSGQGADRRARVRLTAPPDPGSSVGVMSEAAWKAEKDRIAQRNEETRKAGKKERETQERERAARKRTAAAARDEAARANRRAS